MPDFPLTLTDLVIIGILLISAVLAFARGFVHEVLGMTAWVGAALAVVFGLEHVRPYFSEFISLPLLANVAAGGTLFILTLLILSLLTRSISRRVQDSPLNAVDRSLGFLFGLARGALLVCVLYIPVAWLMPKPEQPDWMKDSRSYPLVERGADLLRALVAPETATVATTGDPARERARKALETERMVREMMSPDPKSATAPSAPPPAAGYGDRERRELERLIDGDQ